jgi:hypothetical protein
MCIVVDYGLADSWLGSMQPGADLSAWDKSFRPQISCGNLHSRFISYFSLLGDGSGSLTPCLIRACLGSTNYECLDEAIQ